MKRIGVLTSGGDAPGMNAAIRAVVRTATRRGIEVVGYTDGFCGIVHGPARPLDDRMVGNIIQHGGTILGSARCTRFLEPEVRAEAARRLREGEVEALIVIGGDGSFRGALDLQNEHGVVVAGVPATIDNDIWGTEESIGFDTALNTAVSAIDNIRDTSEATGTMFFIEVMGRESGEMALHTAVAAGAVAVLVPEENEDRVMLLEHLRQSFQTGRRSHLIVVAEGDEAGGAFAIAETVGKESAHPYRVVVLGHVQRGGPPSARDRIIASEAGSLVVEGLAEGRSGFMVGRQRSYSVEVPLADVVRNKHPEVRRDLMMLAHRISG